jgi:predicted CopG family antitoxin
MSTLEEISGRTVQLVRLDTIVKAQLDEIGKKKETYSDIIRRLLEANKERLSVIA